MLFSYFTILPKDTAIPFWTLIYFWRTTETKEKLFTIIYYMKLCRLLLQVMKNSGFQTQWYWFAGLNRVSVWPLSLAGGNIKLDKIYVLIFELKHKLNQLWNIKKAHRNWSKFAELPGNSIVWHLFLFFVFYCSLLLSFLFFLSCACMHTGTETHTQWKDYLNKLLCYLSSSPLLC